MDGAETCPRVMEQGVMGNTAWRNMTWRSKPVPCTEMEAINSNQAEGSLQDHSTTRLYYSRAPAAGIAAPNPATSVYLPCPAR